MPDGVPATKLSLYLALIILICIMNVHVHVRHSNQKWSGWEFAWQNQLYLLCSIWILLTKYIEYIKRHSTLHQVYIANDMSFYVNSLGN